MAEDVLFARAMANNDQENAKLRGQPPARGEEPPEEGGIAEAGERLASA